MSTTAPVVVPSGGGMSAARRGLFVGLCTLDVVQLVERVPACDEKVTSHRQSVAAGGPAANAAAVFAHLGGSAALLTGIGRHPLAAGITADLADLGVHTVDLDPSSTLPPAVSAILVTRGTGERAVASANTGGRRLPPPSAETIGGLVDGADIVVLDGHHMDVALAVARAARVAGRPTLLDGGSWKPGTGELLPWIDVAVCSAAFRPPPTGADPAVGEVVAVLRRLRDAGVAWAAVSRGAEPLEWLGPDGARGRAAVPEVDVVDTLGAGDALHGALAFLLQPGRLTAGGFERALGGAAAVASRSCTSFGTREWMRG